MKVKLIIFYIVLIILVLVVLFVFIEKTIDTYAFCKYNKAFYKPDKIHYCGDGLCGEEENVFLCVEDCICNLPSQTERAETYCKSLELEDFYYNCSQWNDWNELYNISMEIPFDVTCHFSSNKGYMINEYGEDFWYGCGIDYYLEKEELILNEMNLVNHCRGKTLDKALIYCLELLPEELGGVNVILPKGVKLYE